MRLRKRHPDLLIVLAIVVGLGVIITTYTQKITNNTALASEVVYSQNKLLIGHEKANVRTISYAAKYQYQ